jgi:hypothetical protein
MRRKHGGRRARVRGQDKVDADFSVLAAATNLAPRRARADRPRRHLGGKPRLSEVCLATEQNC